ncbi:MAG: aldo/keto reductase [Planctomycetales bacterium]|nr:aldo/keto reductase [Planctomycetales bacterium]
MTHTTLRLRSGSELPAVGLGMWKVPGDACPGLVSEAVRIGYRHFDCACDYGNEAEVGAGLQAVLQSGECSRDEMWITSKLWNTYHRREHVRQACERSLRDLKLDYLDLYLIHFPIATQFVPFDERYPPGWFADPEADQPRMIADRVSLAETWGAMEQLKQDGLVREIGVCNFGVSLLRDLLSYANDPPSVLQVESHPYLVQPKLLRFCREQGIAFTAFSPLGALSYHQLGMADAGDSLLNVDAIRSIADRHLRTPAQVILRWGVQRGTAIIPKTSKPERLRENLGLFDFELTADEMHAINSLDQHRRYNDPGVFCEAAFNTFFPIYE